MTSFDILVVGIIGLSAAIGAWRGLVGEVLSLVAWAAALLAAWMFCVEFGALAFSWIDEPVFRTVAGFASVLVIVLLVVALIKFMLRSLLKALGLLQVDHLLGTAFGMVRGIVIVLLLVVIGGLTHAPKQTWWIEASLASPLETAVLAAKPILPADIAKRVRF